MQILTYSQDFSMNICWSLQHNTQRAWKQNTSLKSSGIVSMLPPRASTYVSPTCNEALKRLCFFCIKGQKGLTFPSPEQTCKALSELLHHCTAIAKPMTIHAMSLKTVLELWAFLRAKVMSSEMFNWPRTTTGGQQTAFLFCQPASMLLLDAWLQSVEPCMRAPANLSCRGFSLPVKWMSPNDLI